MQADLQTTASNDNEAIEEVDKQQADEEQVEQVDDEQDEETTKAIADYTAKIEQLDAKLDAYRVGNVENIKRAELKAMNYSDSQIERYLSHIEGETASEIKASVLELMDVIPPPVDKFGDPSAFNGAKAKPKAKDKTEIGRNAVSRILHKIRL